MIKEKLKEAIKTKKPVIIKAFTQGIDKNSNVICKFNFLLVCKGWGFFGHRKKIRNDSELFQLKKMNLKLIKRYLKKPKSTIKYKKKEKIHLKLNAIEKFSSKNFRNISYTAFIN